MGKVSRPRVYGDGVLQNVDKPDRAYTTERAKRAGKANASSCQIFVTTAPDCFGPILPEHDPRRKTGVRLGESREDRLECRRWGAHLPHIARIAGLSRFGAQLVTLSGGYEDDEDHRDWFLYTRRPSTGSVDSHHYIQNVDKPEWAYTTERAKRDGKPNASSGQIFVTTELDYFGPILPKHDPRRKTGVRVGEIWDDRLECRQWGAHLPHIAGIAGQSRFGA
ncbi:unnamed protein product [Miscanthus lutarioriparius]|uniref:YDG domain-containing protein n=1 Tax=Miscanthus lutarioriparius TaxID=422564 RepID=A0A811QIJ8_9POAL|nr:unnamed protein product [Miscanthus lutarioriparius]